ncbi:MAG TPA: small ribosomal subunit Rsm22 family protein [Candidatus Angelobacter sp.]|nr:small ribosomal subunit Rsm22 family protein [Candidatus Angelobacter sp.]
MRLPAELLDAIQQETDKVDRRKLVQATAQLTAHYKAADFSTAAVSTEAHRAAYLAVRMPATYAALRRVFSEINARAPQAEIASLLDLGSGPATTLFAAAEEFHSLQHATLVEGDGAWIALGNRLAAEPRWPGALKVQWLKQDLRSGLSCETHDLVVISYTLGELPQATAEAVLNKAWKCAGKFLVIIEPGTRRGFAAVNAARSAMIANAAHSFIFAPCPHAAACPMATAGDWCHFSQRVERTSQHRQLKGGDLGYEDEKFSYLVAAKNNPPAAGARIVRHPGKHGGHVQLALCTPQGRIENRTVTRSSKEAYKRARKAEWGDVWVE